MKKIKFQIIFLLMAFALSGCNGKLPGADARKFPADPKKRIEQNMREGKAFRLNEIGKKRTSGEFEFASSNELWRASLDVLDFIPLASANYGGGILITDWYSSSDTPNQSIKISVQFLTNEIRSDAINIKVFTKQCTAEFSCNVIQGNEKIVDELTKQILKVATLYKENDIEKIKESNKDWKYPDISKER